MVRALRWREYTSVPAIRITLVGLPSLFGDIVRATLEHERDMAVIAELHDVDMLRTFGGDPAVFDSDVVVVGVHHGDDQALVSAILDVCPRARVLAISTVRGNTSVHELRPHTTLLGDISPSALVNVIRQGVPQQPPSIAESRFSA